ncbi:hypothetical protein C8Q74DRAFT_1221983 [Fomes fomentarius]|nr:hypothetical protein C8Q74DRAFT_1221983 [Fomes fomentarius]
MAARNLLLTSDQQTYYPVIALRARNCDYTNSFDLSLTVRSSRDAGKLLDRACQELTHILPTACLTSLLVSRATWQNPFAHYPDLESIALAGWSSSHRFWEALQPQPKSSSPASSLPSPMNHHAAVPCPRLKSIGIVVWIVVRKIETESWAMPNALWLRKEHGHPLATLSLDWNYHLPPRAPILKPSDTEYLHKLASSVGKSTQVVQASADSDLPAAKFCACFHGTQVERPQARPPKVMTPVLTTHPLETLAKHLCEAVFTPDLTVSAIRTIEDRLVTLHITDIALC